MKRSGVQNGKQQNSKVPASMAKETCCNKLGVDLRVTYKIRREGNNFDLIIKSVTIIFPLMDWFEIN